MTSRGKCPGSCRLYVDRVCVAPPMFRLFLGEAMGRDCHLVCGVSDRTLSCWGSRVWDRPLRDGGVGMATIRVRFWLGATGPDLRVLLCLRGCRLPLRLVELAGTEACISVEWAACQ